METAPSTEPRKDHWATIRTTLYVIGTLVLFLFSLELLITSLQHLGSVAAEMIILATSNPFTGLFIGLLITAMIQSSSTTTSMAVALVASGSITLESAIPIIMGANIGTTITSTIVALGFINKKKEFRRAVAAGTYHDIFNILTATVLFPLQYYYGFLSYLSELIAEQFVNPSATEVTNQATHLRLGFSPIIEFLITHIDSVFILSIIAFGLLFASIILFRKIIANLLLLKSPQQFSRFFFKSHFKSFFWGFATTALIRSSTVTTSLVVPIVAKRIVSLAKAAPFILGANLGTTITAFIAALLNSNTSSALSLAIAHFLFNFLGVLLFLPIPVLRKVPLELAEALGKFNLKYRMAGFVYLLMTFFIVPFSLIYLNRGATEVLDARYRKLNTIDGTEITYHVISRMNQVTHSGEYSTYFRDSLSASSVPDETVTVYRKNNILFIKNEMHMFNKQGFCWDGENDKGKYKSCVEEILPTLRLARVSFDSVFVFRRKFYDPGLADSISVRYYVSPEYPFILKKETFNRHNEVVIREEITDLKKIRQ